MPILSGEIRDENNALLADATVRAYRRDTGGLLISGRSSSGSAEIPADPHFANVSLLMHCEGAHNSPVVTDSSPTPKALIPNGLVRLAAGQGKFGSSGLYFDALTQYLDSYGDNTGWTMGSGDFTVELFYKMSVLPDAYGRPLITTYNSSNNEAFMLALYPTKAYFYARSTTGLVVVAGDSPAGIDYEWHHLAGVRDGNTLRLFVDGVQVKQGVISGELVSLNGLNIARLKSRTYVGFLGYMDEIRITQGIARYTSAFTPPTAPFTGLDSVPALGTGEFRLETSYNAEVQVIALDPDDGTHTNDLILRTLPV
ncbi:MAG: hypothetical protein KA125_16215 [Chromatiaceae bacterium]|nr:hypothetical protein [Chromatiaceae bacterium]